MKTGKNRRAEHVRTGHMLLGGRIVTSVYTPLGSNHDVLFVNYVMYPGGREFSGFLAWHAGDKVTVIADHLDHLLNHK